MTRCWSYCPTHLSSRCPPCLSSMSILQVSPRCPPERPCPPSLAPPLPLGVLGLVVEQRVHLCDKGRSQLGQDLDRRGAELLAPEAELNTLKQLLQAEPGPVSDVIRTSDPHGRGPGSGGSVTLREPRFSRSCSGLDTPSRTELTPSLRRHQAGKQRH